MEEATNFEQPQQMVVFRLDTENYAIDIFRVNEIIRIREITPIPQTASHIKGLVNLRGKTIPVVDLKTRFDLGESIRSDDTRIIVVESDQGKIGIIVDAVHEVITLTHDMIQAAPGLVNTLESDFVRGLANQNDELITLLDLDKALAA